MATTCCSAAPARTRSRAAPATTSSGATAIPYPRNTTNQTDVLDGGAGDDWIYASHGTNHIDAGPGDDHVFAYFGHGTIDCGPGNDVLTLSKTTQHAYTYVNCEAVEIGYP